MQKITKRKNALQKNSVNNKIILGIFDNTFHSLDDVPKEDRRRYRNSMYYLKRINLLNVENCHTILTDNGIWSAICTKLNISFFALWVIADMYVLEKYSRQHNTYGNYAIGIIEKRFEDIIFVRSFESPIRLLLRQNMIYRTYPKCYKIYPTIFENLKQYDEHLIKLQKHTCQLSIQCIEKTVERSHLTFL